MKRKSRMTALTIAIALLMTVCSAFIVQFPGFPSAAADSRKIPSTTKEFAAELEVHSDALEETFEIPCTDALKKLLFSNCHVPGDTYIKNMMYSAGIINYRYYDYPGSLMFVNCQYYEGKRIVHAWRNGKTALLSSRERDTLEKARQMVSGIQGSDLEKEKAVHDLLCRHVTYYTNSSLEQEEKDCAIGAILNGKADCDGYSDAFYLLGSLVGLEVRFLKGEAISDAMEHQYSGYNWGTEIGGHQWNMVRINGKWSMLDVTWDDHENSIQYFYFNFGKTIASKTHIWEPENLFFSVVARANDDLRPAGLEYTEVKNRDELYNALRSRIGRQERICLTYPVSYDLEQHNKELGRIIYSLGVKTYNHNFGTGCVEITDISLYPHYRICETEAEAQAYLEECASAGTRDFMLFFTPKLAADMFANEQAGVYRILSRSRLKDTNFMYNAEYCRVSISDAVYLDSVKRVTVLRDLFNYLEQQLRDRKTEIICSLPDSINCIRDSDAVAKKIYAMGVSGFKWNWYYSRLTVSEIKYYPEFRYVRSNKEIIDYLTECRSRHPQEIRMYCSDALYKKLSGDDLLSLMREAGLKNNNYIYNNDLCLYIISSPIWK